MHLFLFHPIICLSLLHAECQFSALLSLICREIAKSSESTVHPMIQLSVSLSFMRFSCEFSALHRQFGPAPIFVPSYFLPLLHAECLFSALYRQFGERHSFSRQSPDGQEKSSNSRNKFHQITCMHASLLRALVIIRRCE